MTLNLPGFSQPHRDGWLQDLPSSQLTEAYKEQPASREAGQAYIDKVIRPGLPSAPNMATQGFVAVSQTGSYHVIKATKELTVSQANLRLKMLLPLPPKSSIISMCHYACNDLLSFTPKHSVLPDLSSQTI